jgi:hypothetical protein
VCNRHGDKHEDDNPESEDSGHHSPTHGANLSRPPGGRRATASDRPGLALLDDSCARKRDAVRRVPPRRGDDRFARGDCVGMNNWIGDGGSVRTAGVRRQLRREHDRQLDGWQDGAARTRASVLRFPGQIGLITLVRGTAPKHSAAGAADRRSLPRERRSTRQSRRPPARAAAVPRRTEDRGGVARAGSVSKAIEGRTTGV